MSASILGDHDFPLGQRPSRLSGKGHARQQHDFLIVLATDSFRGVRGLIQVNGSEPARV
jgi:hypothetical protein